MSKLIDFTQAELNLKYMGMEIPQHTCEAFEHYLIKGYKPGGFCEAILAKDYDRALTIADTGNRQMFWAIAMWIKEYAPVECWGSYDIVDDWCDDTNGIRTKFVNEMEKKYIWSELKK